MMAAGLPIQLSFEPWALERCYAAADVLEEAFGESGMEYALLGLSATQDPFHVVETPLLPGQRVTPSTVVQPGRQVLQMREEIDRLSLRHGAPLAPITFIHRHPGSCRPSRTDLVFLRGVFVDQVFTTSSLEDVRPVGACGGCPRAPARATTLEPRETLRSPCSIAFSLIVNQQRDHRLLAVYKRICPGCRTAEIFDVPARLSVRPGPPGSRFGREALRRSLEVEIRSRIHFDREAVPAGARE